MSKVTFLGSQEQQWRTQGKMERTFRVRNSVLPRAQVPISLSKVTFKITDPRVREWSET